MKLDKIAGAEAIMVYNDSMLFETVMTKIIALSINNYQANGDFSTIIKEASSKRVFA